MIQMSGNIVGLCIDFIFQMSYNLHRITKGGIILSVKKGIRVHLESGKIHKTEWEHAKRIKSENCEDYFTVEEAICALTSKRVVPEKCRICFNSVNEE